MALKVQIAGLPGEGKTFVLAALTKVLQEAGMNVTIEHDFDTQVIDRHAHYHNVMRHNGMQGRDVLVSMVQLNRDAK